MTTGGDDCGGGVSGFSVAEEEETPLSGTGGAAGPGTRAGEGQPSGEDIATGANGEAADAEALGSLDDHGDTPALEYGEGDRPRGPTIGEAIGSGAGDSVGSGPPPDHAGIGGGKPPIAESDDE